MDQSLPGNRRSRPLNFHRKCPVHRFQSRPARLHGPGFEDIEPVHRAAISHVLEKRSGKGSILKTLCRCSKLNILSLPRRVVGPEHLQQGGDGTLVPIRRMAVSACAPPARLSPGSKCGPTDGSRVYWAPESQRPPLINRFMGCQHLPRKPAEKGKKHQDQCNASFFTRSRSMTSPRGKSEALRQSKKLAHDLAGRGDNGHTSVARLQFKSEPGEIHAAQMLVAGQQH